MGGPAPAPPGRAPRGAGAGGGGVREVVLATDSDAEGDMTAHHVARAMAELGVRVTRLSRGLPSGSSVEFASPATLGEALEGRREV